MIAMHVSTVALADCVNQIRDDPDNEKTKACLKPAANGWMTCCAEANTFI
jgi:hypothetical protein